MCIRDSNNTAQNWNKVWNKKNSTQLYNFTDVVSFKGGDYFYSPSISYLKSISNFKEDPKRKNQPTYVFRNYGLNPLVSKRYYPDQRPEKSSDTIA